MRETACAEAGSGDVEIVASIDQREIVYYRNRKGELHREVGPAVEWPSGTKFWYRDGKLHREDGPAIEWAHGGKEWWCDGQKHRIDGPATEWSDGRRWWWIRDKPLTEDDFRLQGSCE